MKPYAMLCKNNNWNPDIPRQIPKYILLKIHLLNPLVKILSFLCNQVIYIALIPHCSKVHC